MKVDTADRQQTLLQIYGLKSLHKKKKKRFSCSVFISNNTAAASQLTKRATSRVDFGRALCPDLWLEMGIAPPIQTKLNEAREARQPWLRRKSGSWEKNGLCPGVHGVHILFQIESRGREKWRLVIRGPPDNACIN